MPSAENANTSSIFVKDTWRVQLLVHPDFHINDNTLGGVPGPTASPQRRQPDGSSGRTSLRDNHVRANQYKTS